MRQWPTRRLIASNVKNRVSSGVGNMERLFHRNRGTTGRPIDESFFLSFSSIRNGLTARSPVTMETPSFQAPCRRGW